MTDIDLHIVQQALTGFDDECGDLGFSKNDGNTCFVALVDALGHGKTAFEVAIMARDYLETCHGREPSEVIKGIHDHLKGTRGAVAAVCRLNLDTGCLTYSGMGNITLRILGSRQERLVTREGILGYMIPTPRQKETQLFPGDTFLMSSDGIREHFDPDEIPELFTGSAKDIAEGMIRQLGKKNDDASCIVLRYGI